MPFDDLPTMWDGALLAEQSALDRRRALLAEQAKQAAAQIGIFAPPAQPGEVGGFTSAVTGTRVPGRQLKIPAAALLSPAIANIGNQIGQSRLDDDTQAFNARVQADALRRISQMPQGTPAQPADPGIQPLTPNDDEGNPMPIPKEATPARPAQDAPLADVLRWQLSLADNPRTAPLSGKLMENTLITMPLKRQEQIIEYLKLVETNRHNTAEEGKPITVPQVGAYIRDKNYDASDPRGWKLLAQTPDKPLPEEATKAWRTSNATMTTLNNAIAAFDTPAGRGATGPLIGLLSAIPGIGPAAANWVDPAGRATRALVTGIGALKIHDITGAAYGLAEFDRLRPYIPQVGDDAPTIRDKLQNLQRETAIVQEEILKQAADQKYRSPTGRVEPRKPAELKPNPNGPNPPVRLTPQQRESLGAKPPAPKSEAEYNALPRGTEYQHPDDPPGKLRIK